MFSKSFSESYLARLRSEYEPMVI